VVLCHWFANIQLDPTLFDLGVCVEDAIEMVAAKNGKDAVHFACVFQDNVPQFIMTDKTRFTQLLVCRDPFILRLLVFVCFA